MSEWRELTIEELAAKQKSALATGPFGSAVSSKNFRFSGVPMLRGSNLSDDVGIRLDERDLVFLDPDLASTFARSAARKGDLVFTCWGSVGQIGFIGEDANYDEYIVSNKQMKLSPNVEQVDPLFLYYNMSQPKMIFEVQSRAIGSTIPGFNLGQLRALKVQIPELLEQRAIAAVLGALDDKIAANARVTAATAELATSHFSRAYQYADRTLSLSDLVSTQYGITTSAHGEPGPKFLRVTDINKKPWIEWDRTPNCTVSDLELRKYRVSAGDILVARMADPGKAALIDVGDPEAVFASYLVRLKPHNPAQALYLYYFLRSQQYLEYAQGAMSGSVQKNMNAKVIVATDVGLPDPNRILQFNETVAPLRGLIQSHLEENRKLAATRDTLLPQLMSGKLRVKDAEKVLENAGV